MKAARFLALGAFLAAMPASAQTSYYPPLSSQIDLSDLPGDFARPVGGGRPLGERIRVKNFRYQEIENAATGDDVGARIRLGLVIDEGFELELPGLENAITVAVGVGDVQAEATLRQEHSPIPEEDFPMILKIRPPPNIVSLRFRTDILKPVQPGTFEPYSGVPPIPELRLGASTEIRIRYTWDGDSDFELIDTSGARPVLTLNTPVMIGDTGIVLEVQDAEIDLSRTSSAAGLPGPWVGVRFRRLAISFVNGLDVPRLEHGPGAPPPPPEIAGLTVTDFAVGSGGVSGSICGTLSPGHDIELFDSNFRLERLCVELTEGSLTSGEAAGELSEFPYFENAVDVTLNLSLDGNFKVALAPPDPSRPTTAFTLTVPDVLAFQVEAFSLEKKLDLYIWKMSGKLNVDALSTAPADAIEVNGLSIASNGVVTLDGGWLVLPGKKTFDFHGFGVELAEIGFGSEQPSPGPLKKWVGFSGGVQLSGGFDAAARFRRLEVSWPGGSAPFDVRLAGVEVNFRRPGVIAFSGAVDFFERPGENGFAGAISCHVEAIRLAVAARLVIGDARPQPGTPFRFFYIDLAVSLPAGIPLFPGVSLYGLLGQFGSNVNPNIEAFDTPLQWFETHQREPNLLAGTPHPPWRARSGSFAVGAGVLLGTMPDDGFSANAKLSVMVSLPGPVVMLQGAANILRSRGDLITAPDPAFTCLAIFDGNSNTFLLNIGAYYSVFNLIVASGEAEAFFNLNDPNDWHLWIGQDQPEERRIRAEVLSFLKANAYFMLDPAGLRQGAKAGYDAHWEFGPLDVTLVAFFAYDMSLFFRPIHVWGLVQMKGQFELSAFGIGIGLMAHASLEGETPAPFLIEGEFHVKISLPWPLPDPEATITLRWEDDAEKEPLQEWVAALGIEPRKPGFAIRPDTISFSGDSSRAAPPATVSESDLCTPGDSVAGEGQADIACSKPLVPLDVLLVAAFQRPTNDVNGLGHGNDFDAAFPKVDAVKNTRFQYNLDSFELVQARKGSPTLNFDTPLTRIYGAWPAVAGGIEPAALSMRLFSRNPLDVYSGSTYLFYENDTKGWTEWALGTYGRLYCGGEPNRDPGSRGGSPLAPGAPCDIPPEMVSGEDFILPPYSAFRLTVDGDVVRSETGPDRIYRNTAIFHTEGPPLELGPYVDTTFPDGDRRPHYRAYDVGIRFNETYMNLMYREPGQIFQLQVLDDNDQPVRSAGSEVLIYTDWDTAAFHTPKRTEDDWLQFLREHGVAVDAITPKDDRTFGRVSAPEAIRGNERHRVRVWLEDPRLAADERLTDARWREKNPIRHQTGNRVVLYEFPILYSRFATFRELIETHRGDYVEIAVNPAANRTNIGTWTAQTDRFVADFGAGLNNGSAEELGRYLRHALSPRGPESVPDDERDQWLRRAPGYNGRPERMTADERRAVLAQWEAALSAFEKIEEELGLATFRGPLPETFEISPLRQGGDVIGFLCESPEAIDFTRIELALRTLVLPWSEVQVVPNRDNTRFFVFHSGLGAVQPWLNGLYEWRFHLHRWVSDRYPLLRHPDGADRETAFAIVGLPDDAFVPESP